MRSERTDERNSSLTLGRSDVLGQGVRVLFVALNNDVGTERVPIAMGALGAECGVMSPPDFYCGTTRFVTRRFPLARHRGAWLGVLFVRRRLEAAMLEWQPDLVVPLDHIAAQLLRALVQDELVSPQLRRVLRISLGSPSGYVAACRRVGLMQEAARLGVRQPAFCASDNPAVVMQAAERLGYPAVLKQENTCGGHGVSVVTDPSELRAALALTFGQTAVKRLRTALRAGLWRHVGLGETARLPVVLQAFVAGRPAMRTVATWEGQVLEGVSFVAEHVHPAPTGSSTVVRYTENPEMTETVERLVAALGCSGFVSFDFVVDEDTGQASLIEMNPRPIAATGLGSLFGHDPCAALLSRLTGTTPRKDVPRLPLDRLVALFPREVERDAGNLSRLTAATLHHDVPHDDPGVMAAYLKHLSRVHPTAMPDIRRALSRADCATQILSPGPIRPKEKPGRQ